MFNAAYYEVVAEALAAEQRGFDRQRFLKVAKAGLADLTLIQRVRRTSEAAQAALPGDFLTKLDVIRHVAPRLPRGFTGIWLPDFVGCFGQGHLNESLEGLRFLTPFSSAEFAVREFLKRDLERTLAAMTGWSRDENEHVRRLASEGSRPRLPWSFRLERIVADPALTAGILDNLKDDPSLYVRKSVANHLNDVSKDHPDWMLARLKSWDLTHPHTRWIARHASRTLIKAGHRAALTLFDFGGNPRVKIATLKVGPKKLRLGQTLAIACAIESTARQEQRLAVDYVIHYVKAAGATSAKVFKWREVTLAPGATISLAKNQVIRDFTTRRHYAGRHRVEIQVNGRRLASGHFDLSR